MLVMWPRPSQPLPCGSAGRGQGKSHFGGMVSVCPSPYHSSIPLLTLKSDLKDNQTAHMTQHLLHGSPKCCVYHNI